MNLLLICLVFLAALLHADALKCYTCSSNDYGQCTDPFSLEFGGRFLKECGPAAVKCSKIKHEVGAGLTMVVRGCVTVFGQDFCNIVENHGVICSTCSTDACNGATSVSLGVASLLPLLVAIRTFSN